MGGKRRSIAGGAAGVTSRRASGTSSTSVPVVPPLPVSSVVSSVTVSGSKAAKPARAAALAASLHEVAVAAGSVAVRRAGPGGGATASTKVATFLAGDVATDMRLFVAKRDAPPDVLADLLRSVTNGRLLCFGGVVLERGAGGAAAGDAASSLTRNQQGVLASLRDVFVLALPSSHAFSDDPGDAAPTPFDSAAGLPLAATGGGSSGVASGSGAGDMSPWRLLYALREMLTPVNITAVAADFDPDDETLIASKARAEAAAESPASVALSATGAVHQLLLACHAVAKRVRAAATAAAAARRGSGQTVRPPAPYLVVPLRSGLPLGGGGVDARPSGLGMGGSELRATLASLTLGSAGPSYSPLRPAVGAGAGGSGVPQQPRGPSAAALAATAPPSSVAASRALVTSPIRRVGDPVPFDDGDTMSVVALQARRHLMTTLADTRHAEARDGAAVEEPKLFVAVGSVDWDGVAFRRGVKLTELPSVSAGSEPSAVPFGVAAQHASASAKLLLSSHTAGTSRPQPAMQRTGLRRVPEYFATGSDGRGASAGSMSGSATLGRAGAAAVASTAPPPPPPPPAPAAEISSALSPGEMRRAMRALQSPFGKPMPMVLTTVMSPLRLGHKHPVYYSS